MNIVGGDFYHYAKVDENTCYITAVDSTGHGVPGGFMSMLGVGYLKDAISRGKDPGDVISIMNNTVKSTLNPGNAEMSLSDGFDLGICRIDPKNCTVEFAGAFRPLWITRPESTEVEEIKGTRTSIGGRTPLDQIFETTKVQLKKGDCLYMFTDGCTDQFNDARKRISTKRFKEVLLSIRGLDMKEQCRYVERFLETWQGNAGQTDDIMLVALKI
jgi:serine phosphatase RsbU (regulator of sigma subunit)